MTIRSFNHVGSLTPDIFGGARFAGSIALQGHATAALGIHPMIVSMVALETFALNEQRLQGDQSEDGRGRTLWSPIAEMFRSPHPCSQMQ